MPLSRRWGLFVWLATAPFALAQTQGDRYPVVIDGKVGFIDSLGNEVIPPQFVPVADLAHFAGGLAPVAGPDGAGYIDVSGRFVIGPDRRWGQPQQFHEGIAEVLIWGENGAPTTPAFVDKAGKIVFSIAGARGHGYFAESLMPLEDAGKWGFVDKSFHWAIPAKFDFAHEFSDGLAPVQVGRKWGYIDKAGNAIVPPKYDMAWSFSDGLGRIRSIDLHRFGFVDREGKEVIPPQFESATNFRHGRAFAMLPGSRRLRIIDNNGSFVRDAEYDQASEFHEGVAAACVGGKWGYVDTSGRWVIAPQFNGADDFWHGLAQVTWGHGHGYIDRSGTVVWSSIPRQRA